MHPVLKHVRNEFDIYCRSKFPVEEDAKLVYNIYHKLKYPNTSPNHKFMILSERKRINLEYFILTYGIPATLEGINYYNLQLQRGLVKSNTLSYFTSVVENFIKKPVKENTYTPSTYISNTATNAATKERIVPRKEIRARSDYQDEFFNWNYKCACGTIVDPWTQECPHCKAFFLWENVKII